LFSFLRCVEKRCHPFFDVWKCFLEKWSFSESASVRACENFMCLKFSHARVTLPIPVKHLFKIILPNLYFDLNYTTTFLAKLYFDPNFTPASLVKLYFDLLAKLYFDLNLTSTFLAKLYFGLFGQTLLQHKQGQKGGSKVSPKMVKVTFGQKSRSKVWPKKVEVTFGSK